MEGGCYKRAARRPGAHALHRHSSRNCQEKTEKKSELGATPAASVSVAINTSLNAEAKKSPFLRTSRGYYVLRSLAEKTQKVDFVDKSDPLVTPTTGIINALGMFWERSKVIWKPEPQLFGIQQQDSQAVDFCKEVGVYFLHDSQGFVYVGRTTDQSLGRRLHQHTIDRLSGRWARFSWFGIYPVEETGKLRTDADVSKVGLDVVISTLEAVLIEGLEPRQNRRRGDDFQAVEFSQFEDPAIKQDRQHKALAELAAQFGKKISN